MLPSLADSMHRRGSASTSTISSGSGSGTGSGIGGVQLIVSGAAVGSSAGGAACGQVGTSQEYTRSIASSPAVLTQPSCSQMSRPSGCTLHGAMVVVVGSPTDPPVVVPHPSDAPSGGAHGSSPALALATPVEASTAGPAGRSPPSRIWLLARSMAARVSSSG